MALTFGTGPLAAEGENLTVDKAGRLWFLEDWPRRMRAVLGSENVVDTRGAKLLHESDLFPMHYFPLADVRTDLLEEVEGARDDARGPMRCFNVRAGERLAEGAVTTFPEPPEGAPPLQGYAAIDFWAMDRWFEEDEPVYGHPRDPYHRVDVRASSRHVQVRYGDLIVAESSRPKIMFETSTPIRYYLPWDDVRIDLMEESETVSECPYKGNGQHWHLIAGSEVVRDACWSLPHPLPEGLAAVDHVCFYPGKVEVLLDGEPVEPE